MKTTLKKILRELIKGKNIYNSPVYRKIYFPIARFLAMHGYASPFVQDERKYWSSRKSGDIHGPDNYVEESDTTYVLFEELLKIVDRDASFLEIGCNAGRNLNYLKNKGFRNLAGIEINESSIHDTLKNQFPDLYNSGLFYVGNASEQIKKIPDESYDITFSIGVLEHIHPEDKSLFEDMVRVTRRYLAVITSENSRVYPYDFEKVFNRLGCKTVLFRLFYGKEHNFKLAKEPFNEDDHFFDSKFLRIFIKNQ